MTSLYILVPLSVLLVFVIGIIFWWSVRSGQFDDLEGPAYRMLLDDRDELPQEQKEKSAKTEQAEQADNAADKTP